MRFDDIGLFWEDLPQKRGGGNVVRMQPPIPDTGWQLPREFPNLAAAKTISLDTETYDPELLEYGPGWARGKGHIVGVSIAADNDGKWYFPMRHEVEPEWNINPDHVLAWLSDSLSNASQPKIGANLYYDLGWLREEGVRVAGQLIDVQYAEALLQESGRVELDLLGEKYVGEHKESNLLYRWCADYYTGKADGKQRANIYRAPPRLVGPYAESDAILPLQIASRQYPLLLNEGLLELFYMECEMIPLLIDMRYAGVSIDINKADEVSSKLEEESQELKERLKSMVGFEVNVNANDSLGKAFDKLGLHYNLTVKSKKPSFTQDFLKNLEHPIGGLIKDIRTVDKINGTFIQNYLMNAHVNNKVYCQFHPLRGEKNGTRSGRYSSSTPNLQNIPSRNPKLAPLVRGLFIPDKDHVAWRKYDYSQIEYRFLVHYAIGSGADEVRQIFIDNPNTDYHELVRQLVHEKVGVLLERKPTKNVNFGLVYGMGQRKLCRSLGLSKAQGESLFRAYHEGAPFVKTTMDATMAEAQRLGVVTTILGRKSRFELWEPARWDESGIALPYDKAILRYGNIKRAYTHKALNRRLQGSAAELMKVAMYQCWKAGIFDITGVPRLTVHDELDFSDPGGKDEAFREMKNIMETAIKIKIPVKVDVEVGPDWGHVEEIKLAA